MNLGSGLSVGLVKDVHVAPSDKRDNPLSQRLECERFTSRASNRVKRNDLKLSMSALFIERDPSPDAVCHE